MTRRPKVAEKLNSGRSRLPRDRALVATAPLGRKPAVDHFILRFVRLFPEQKHVDLRLGIPLVDAPLVHMLEGDKREVPVPAENDFVRVAQDTLHVRLQSLRRAVRLVLLNEAVIQSATGPGREVFHDSRVVEVVRQGREVYRPVRVHAKNG